VPDRIIGTQAGKPAVQQVEVQLLEQQPLGANPVERLQQRGQHQLLGGHRCPGLCCVQLTNGGIEVIQGLIRQLPDPPQRMAARDSFLDRHVGEQGATALPVSSRPG